MHATPYVERDSQKGTVIGKGGARLREVGTAARTQIEKLLGTRIYLDLRVTVPKNWQRDPKQLGRFGFYGPAKSPTAVILLPSQAVAKPPAVKAQFKMIARCEGLFIHKSSAAVGVAADPVPQ